jgi:hypothetical protein
MYKLFLLVIALAASWGVAHAQYGPTYGGVGGVGGMGTALRGTGSNPSAHSVDGYVNSNGTYVAPHMQTNPNGTQLDNYGTRGNVNPYTGAVGTRSGHY